MAKFSRSAVVNFVPYVETKTQETKFKLWAKSFEQSVAEILLTIDSDEWECKPARDAYSRFGWDERIEAKHILGWWMWRLLHFKEMGWKEPIRSYEAAIRQIKAAL